MRVEPDRSGRKRILSSTSAAEMEPDRKLCRLSVVAGRSPLRTIQQSRRRSKPTLAKKSSLVDGCVEVAAAARTRAAPGGEGRASAGAPQHQPLAKISHGYDTRAAANKRRTENTYLAAEKRAAAAEKKPQPPVEKAEGVQLVTEKAETAETADEKVETATQPLLLARHPASGFVATTETLAKQPTENAEEEYMEEILQELLDQERLQQLEPDFLAGQHAVTAADRAVVVDWLILVQHYLRLENGSLQLAVALLDRALAEFSCPLDSLQLLGVACLWLAAKMEDPRLPSARQLLKLTMDGYSLASLLDMELLVLHVVRFRLLRVHSAALVPLQLHRRRLVGGQQGARLSQTCSYLLDLAVCRLGGIHRPPSLVAASVINAAQLLLSEHGDGGDAMVDSEMDFFYHREEDVMSMTTLILLELRDSQTSKLQGACKKYSSQSRYQGLALCDQLSPEHAQRVLLRHLGRPLPRSAAADPARLSQEF